MESALKDSQGTERLMGIQRVESINALKYSDDWLGTSS